MSVAATGALGECLKPPLNKADPIPKHSRGVRMCGFSSVLSRGGLLCHFGHPSTGIPAHSEGGRREDEEEGVCLPSVQTSSSQTLVPSSHARPGLSICP